MSQPTSGLLPALVGYYQRLQDDPNEGIADFGFSIEKIHFQIVLEPDGSLVSFNDIRERNNKGKPIPRPLVVPDGGGRSGTGMKPFFCWDNTGYTLGRDNKGKPERAAEMFAAFRDLHRSFLPDLADDEGFAALCRFLDAWDPARAESLENWEEAAGMNVVFKLRGQANYIHQSQTVKDVWLRSQSKDNPDENRVLGISLLNGEEEELARLHPQIRGVAGANTMGAAIVSFNLSAFESYGKSQSFNAPVGTRDAFRYTTSLNRLLDDSTRRVRIGDATVVFWSDRQEGQDAEPIFREIFGDDFPRDAEHAATVDRLRGFLEAARQGRLGDVIQNPDAPFYVLGLSPNASRLNVRYWLAGTVNQFARRLAEHVEQLEIVGSDPESPPLTIRRLIRETAREPKEIPPQLAADITHAIFLGTPYPRALFDAVMRRIRAEASVNHVKAAILKAFFLRREVGTVRNHLNETNRDPAYLSGRMFAVLAFAQEAAMPGVNTGIVRRSMGATMSTPGLMLGRLLRAAEVGHIPKLNGRLPQFVHDEIENICIGVEKKFPRMLDLTKQGIFALGFYQEQHFLRDAKLALREGRLYCNKRGQWMRSQLEVIVSEVLDRHLVNYIYEVRSAYKPGAELWPDFYIKTPASDIPIYFEVLGGSPGNQEKYDERWEYKRKAYQEIGIVESIPGEDAGGQKVKGRLVVLDWRKEWGPEPRKSPVYPDDEKVMTLLRPHITSPFSTKPQ